MVMGELTQETELLIVGGGPGGYAAAFRAADLGMDVTVVSQDPKPGGVCLHTGCIPSKTLLYLAELIMDARRAADMGVIFGPPRIDIDGVRAFKNSVTEKLAGGLVNLFNRRGVQWIQARAEFEDSGRVRLHGGDISRFKFKHAIVASGSHTVSPKNIRLEPRGRVMDSTGALELPDIPESLLVVGGGYVALELGSVYAALGSRVTLIVHRDRLIRGADPDLVEPLKRKLLEVFEAVHFNTELEALQEEKDWVQVTFKGNAPEPRARFDRLLIAVGRRPNTDGLGLERTQVTLTEHGFIQADDRQRTSDPRIYAVGDVVGGTMLAHKAMREGKVAAEVIAGLPSAFDAKAIPAVVYTDPQIAWCGLTEEEAERQKRPIRVARFPWKVSGRALSMGTPQGFTKMIVDPDTQRILGLGIVGRGAEGLIAEGVLAVEMGALAEDVALSIHAHPTLSETEGEAAEVFLGTATHILPSRKKSR